MDGMGAIRLQSINFDPFLIIMYLFPLGNLEINAFKRDLHSPIGIFSLPCTQTDPETSDVGHKVARIIRSSTFPDTSSLGSVFCGQEWRKKLQHVSQGLS